MSSHVSATQLDLARGDGGHVPASDSHSLAFHVAPPPPPPRRRRRHRRVNPPVTVATSWWGWWGWAGP